MEYTGTVKSTMLTFVHGVGDNVQDNGNVCNDSEKGSRIKEMCGNRTVKTHSRRKIG